VFKFDRCESLQVAHNLLEDIEAQLTGIRGSVLATYFHVESYANGREQGLMIKGYDHHAIFAQNRNSDHIVVYLAEGATSFSLQGNVPQDEAYKDRQLFGSDQYKEAADCVLTWLMRDHLLRADLIGAGVVQSSDSPVRRRARTPRRSQ
jgi:hypothetical protein